VSSDGDFASDMNDLRRNHRSYFNPVIAIIGDINPMASRPNRPIANPALLSAADKVIHWADIEALAAVHKMFINFMLIKELFFLIFI